MGSITGIKRRSPFTYDSRPFGAGSTGPTGPGVGSTGPTGPGGTSDVVVFNTFADLKAGGPGAVGDAALLNGYHAPGDGGGGPLAWDANIVTGDDILVIQPTGVITGGWVRNFDGPINVKWGGAYGDGDHDDTASIQAVLNVVLPAVQNPNAADPVLSVFMPSGVYNVTPPMNQPALSINQPTVLTGVGAGFVDQATRIACSGYAPATAGSAALTIEGVDSAAAGSKIDGIAFVGHGIHMPQDLLVIHASNVTVLDCGFSNCWRFGICGSSGTTGTGPSDSALGMSSIPGNGVNAHFAQILNCYALSCGDIAPTLAGGESNLQVQCTANFIQPAIGGAVTVQVNTTAPFTWDARNPHPIAILQLGAFGTDMYILDAVVDPTHITITNIGAADSTDAVVTPPTTVFGNGLWFNEGSGLCVYGVDANGWNIVSFNNGNCCNGTLAIPQGSATFTACYAQGTYYSHIDSAAGIETYVGCNQETVSECILQLGAQILVVGGSCASGLKGGAPNYPAIVGASNSYFSFQQLGADGATYLLQPLAYSSDCVFFFRRTLPNQTPNQDWTFGYQTLQSTSPWGAPFQPQSWSYFGPSGLNGSFSPFGFTDTQNPRGWGMPFISNPTMNAPMHFSWKQAVTLASGANTVYLNGGVGSDAGAVPFLTDPTIVQLDPTVYVTGGGPPVTFTGTPTEALAPIEIDITGGGTTFTWKLNGATQATGVAIAPSVVLGATGVTANFSGTYANGQTYEVNSQWGNAQRKMNIELEFTSAALPTADCEIVGYAFVSEGSGTYNAACQIKNNAGSPVNVTVVWTYDVFVTNYIATSGNIG